MPLENYEEVPDRIRRFFEKYPDGSLQGTVEDHMLPAAHLGGEPCLHLVYKAFAYRTPDDKRPGIGMASEPVPGLTNFTKGSELMNAETSAWGRALVALGFVAKTVASAHEVRARGGGGEDPGEPPTDAQKKGINRRLKAAGVTKLDEAAAVYEAILGRPLPEGKKFTDALTKREASKVIDRLEQGAVPTGKSDVPDDTSEFVQPSLEGGDPVPFEEPT